MHRSHSATDSAAPASIPSTNGDVLETAVRLLEKQRQLDMNRRFLEREMVAYRNNVINENLQTFVHVN